MNILENVSLKDYVTMRLGGQAKYLVEVNSEDELVEAVELANTQNLKILVLGKGSNIIFKDTGFDGLVILNKILGNEIDKKTGLVRANSGVVWDDLVDKTIEKGLFGIEATSYIPGTVGAAPINNIGAYGQELKDTLIKVRAFEIESKNFVEFTNEECNFSYRNSRFKSKDWGKYIITSIELKLHLLGNEEYKLPEYQSVIEKLEADKIKNPGPADIRAALKFIRGSKLPDPKKLPNTGSFYKNPIVDQVKANELKSIYTDLPTYTQDNGTVKLAAGWLIDNAGLRNYRQNGMWVYKNQALVLVNESAKSYLDLKSISTHIIETVKNKYGIELEPEPEII